MDLGPDNPHNRYESLVWKGDNPTAARALWIEHYDTKLEAEFGHLDLVDRWFNELAAKK